MQHRSSADIDNDGRFPDGSDVLTPYPLTKQQEQGDRAAWPWLHGWVTSQCGPDEWQICVQEPALGRLDDGTIPPPGTPEDECNFPVCFRDASEIRPASPDIGELRAIFTQDEPGPHEPRRAGTSPVCIVCGREHPQ
jgi:hypothetical protein